MVEYTPVHTPSRRDMRRHRARTRAAGVGGLGAALGITAVVVIAPVAQGSSGIETSVAAAPVAAIAAEVPAVKAPYVDSYVLVEVPTVTKNPPPPVSSPAKAAKKAAKGADVSSVLADGHKDCGDKGNKNKRRD